MLVGVLFIPEPYSHPLIDVAMSPTYLLNFFINREMLDFLTVLMFGGPKQNDGPVLINILLVFWFFLSMILLFTFRYILKKVKQNKQHFK